MIIDIADGDAAQVRAILLTHAELQDREAISNEELQGQLKNDGEAEMAEDLADIHKDLTEDTDNLKRLAEIFV